MSYDSKDQVNNAKDFSASCRSMTNLPCVMIVRASYLDIMNGLKKLIDDLDLFSGLGSLVEFDSNRSRITRLIELQVFPELQRNRRFLPSEEFDPSRCIDKDSIWHGGF